MAYATLQDVYDLGLTAHAFVTRPRAIDPNAGDSLDPASGLFSLIGHGYAPDDILRFVQAARGSAPTGASLAAFYNPIIVNGFAFRISLTTGGGPLTFADAGSGWSLQIDPERRLQRHLDMASADLDQDLTAHATPILRDVLTGRYPAKLIGINARMAARSAVPSLMFDNAAFRVALDRIAALEAKDDAQREQWRNGQPLLPQPTDQTTIADNGAKAGQDMAPTAWRTGYL